MKETVVHANEKLEKPPSSLKLLEIPKKLPCLRPKRWRPAGRRRRQQGRGVVGEGGLVVNIMCRNDKSGGEKVAWW